MAILPGLPAKHERLCLVTLVERGLEALRKSDLGDGYYYPHYVAPVPALRGASHPEAHELWQRLTGNEVAASRSRWGKQYWQAVFGGMYFVVVCM